MNHYLYNIRRELLRNGPSDGFLFIILVQLQPEILQPQGSGIVLPQGRLAEERRHTGGS